ncbi:hypothetical protein K388_07342 [Streptomyces sp. KhCrAH-43]|uniref:hypothetical protein n=1 Tax=unclassified Streptomyces TaxID=2593676 RepID=UPI00036C6283|nr:MULTISPECIES: hypothetical protein [unclassified Streptomyces]MYS33458.1 hypothetical protein [Streptomyces sp. SID4920]MYX63701.1 hypothetical protein [Streptomyces sp. SID8373]RAJ45326.1 hypothetical protein K388_07342 [Streptomyces sp. KhCrAH-43]
MPTIPHAPTLPECVTVIICAECATHPFTAAADHTFRCPCGSWITARDIDLDGATVWAVTRTGHLAYLPDPADAWERYVEARTVMDDPGQWGPDLEAAHRAFREALAELEAAQLLAVQLPDGADVQIGRVYLACVLNADGTLSGSNASALGWPCEACSPRATDPYYQQRYPCRNPRDHAWTQVRDWERNVNTHRNDRYVVRSPLAPDLPTARRLAAEKCAARAAALTA